MESKKKKTRKKAKKTEKSEEKQPLIESKLKPSKIDKIPFVSWFYKQVKAGKLKPWQEKEITLFFNHHGLDTIEDEEAKYTELLKRY